jgi:nucleotide-binding universal stress UspA family protein
MSEPRPSEAILLVPVDNSECASRALDFAMEQARRRKDVSIHVLTVHPELRLYGEVAVYVGRDKMRELASRHDRAILDRAAAQLQSSGVRFKTEAIAEAKDVATTISQRAAALGCEQIVMGTRGHGHIAGLLLGSVAAKVVHLAEMPVTLVK